MAEILLVNPRRRRRRRARRRMSAKQRMYFAPRRKSRARKSVRRRRNPVSLLPMANPRRRRRRASGYVVGTKRIRRRKLNPSGRFTLQSFTRAIVPTVQDGFTGAVGGLGLDVLMGFIGPRLPVALQSGFAKDAVKVIGGVAVGLLGNMILRGKGRQLAIGAVTIALHDVLKSQLQAMNLPIPLGEYGYMNPGSPVGAYLEDQSGMTGYGAYVEPDSLSGDMEEETLDY